MVATLLSLRWTSLRHNLRREPWRVVMLVLAALWSLSMVPSVALAGLWLGQQEAEVAATVLTVAGALLTLGWALVPVIIPALDDTLDIERFAASGVDPRRLVPALLVAALLGVPTLVTAGVSLVPAASWWLAGERGAALTALAAAPAAVLTCLLAARLTTLAARRLLVTRRARRLAVLSGVGALLLIALGTRRIAALGLERTVEAVPGLADVIGWTPLAAAWAAPGAVADGDVVGGVARLALGAAAAVAAAVWWGHGLRRRLVDPPPRSGLTRRRRDAMLPRRRWRSRSTAPGLIAAGAVARRGLRSWASDPRYLASLLSAVVLPAVVVGAATAVVEPKDLVIVGAGVLMAGSLGWGRHNDVAYDGSAFWMHVAAAVPGWADRLGRTAATALWAGPLVAAVGAAGALVAGRPTLVPAAAGAALGVLATGLATSALLSSVLPYPVPAPGADPFAVPAGGVIAGLIAQAVAITVTAALAAPVVGLLVVTMTGHPGWGTATAIAGPLWGALVVAGGILAGGRLHDLRAARVLHRLG